MEGTPFKEIPIIDLNDLYSDNTEKLVNIRKELNEACKNIGFFYIKNYHVDQWLTEKVLEETKKFFNQRIEEKQKVNISKSGKAARGYFGIGEEWTNLTQDYKEGYDMGVETPPEHPDAKRALHGLNQWPENLQDFKRTMQEYFRQMEKLGSKLMSLVALNLNLEENFFDKLFEYKPFSKMILLHYPSTEKQKSEKLQGVGEHTDYGCLTFVLQKVKGLQVKNYAGEWIDADPISDTLVCNLGDFVEIWTNGIYKSTPHRVVASRAERISIPFFYEPSFDCEAVPLSHLVAMNPTKKYEPKQYGKHLLAKQNHNYTYRQNDKQYSTID